MWGFHNFLQSLRSVEPFFHIFLMRFSCAKTRRTLRFKNPQIQLRRFLYVMKKILGNYFTPKKNLPGFSREVIYIYYVLYVIYSSGWVCPQILLQETSPVFAWPGGLQTPLAVGSVASPAVGDGPCLGWPYWKCWFLDPPKRWFLNIRAGQYVPWTKGDDFDRLMLQLPTLPTVDAPKKTLDDICEQALFGEFFCWEKQGALYRKWQVVWHDVKRGCFWNFDSQIFEVFCS